MQKLLSVLILTLLVTNCLTEDPTDASLTTKTTLSPTLPPTSSTKQPSTTVVPTSSSLNPTAPPKTTTEVPTTTTLPTTSVSPTTTVEPTTTTSEPTTQPKTSTTSLPTSTPGPLTTKAPPVPKEGSWNVTLGNTTCIRATLKVLFKIQLENEVDYIALSPNASSDGSLCKAENGTQELKLTDSSYVLKFIFEKDSENVYVRNISFSYNVPGSSDTVTNDTRLFNVKSGNSYMCAASTEVILDNVTMEISKIHIQAFGNPNNKDFGTAEECDADNPVNDIVPIAVGVALLALVVVVLIAYLVGRRRSRQKGYQSV